MVIVTTMLGKEIEDVRPPEESVVHVGGGEYRYIGSDRKVHLGRN